MRPMVLPTLLLVLSTLGWPADGSAQTARGQNTKAGRGAAASAAAKTASGVVKARTADSLTINSDDGKDWTFAIDQTTKVVGKPVNPKASATAKATITDIVTLGDVVSVGYDEKDGKMRAGSVRVTTKYEDRFR